MTGVLLDTNVVSETVRPEPNSRVLAFLTADHQFWLSTMVVHELDFGVKMLPAGRRRDRIAAALRLLVTSHTDRILPIGIEEAEHAASLRARAQKSGRVLDLGDALIAATAAVNNLAVATRNTKHFEGLDLEVIDPWS
jgi:predicted nucleic acid-binding protein